MFRTGDRVTFQPIRVALAALASASASARAARGSSGDSNSFIRALSHGKNGACEPNSSRSDGNRAPVTRILAADESPHAAVPFGGRNVECDLRLADQRRARCCPAAAPPN